MTDLGFVAEIKGIGSALIGGEWVELGGGDHLELICPSTEEPFVRVAAADAATLSRAIAAAREAFDNGPWPRMSPAERAALMDMFADKLAEKTRLLAASWTAQIGTPISLAEMSVPYVLDRTRYTAGLARAYPFEEVRETPPGVAIVRREAVGVVAAIAPWNAPFGILLSKIVGALLCGCTVIAKPSPETPLEALLIAEAAEETGFPKGVISILACTNEVADALIRDPRVDKVSFTGSTAVGRHIASICSDRIARTTLELGGKSAAIILDDADLDATVAQLAPSLTMLSGQVCAALTRVVVSERMEKPFIERFSAALDGVRIGDPFARDTAMGPIAMRRQLERIEAMVAGGVREGASIARGGRRLARTGFFYEPTILADVDSRMEVAQDEIFGPVACVLTYRDEDEAVRIANDSRYGLSGAVFTSDLDRGYAVASAVRTGNFGVNAHNLDPRVPFGGFKQSGYGREGGTEGLDAYVEIKSVMMSALPRAFA